MQEILRYVGGGFLAVVVGCFFLNLFGNVREVFAEVSFFAETEEKYQRHLELAYGESVQGLWVDLHGMHEIAVNVRVKPEDYIDVYDEDGREQPYEITRVRNTDTGLCLTKTGRYYIFKQPGIYEIYLNCHDRQLRVCIPMNERRSGM